MLDDLRARIRHTLLVDRLGPASGPRMTATEVVERASETTRLLGATYGRLQAELLTPLLTRAVAILRRRGEIPDLALDGRTVDLQYKSPLARTQARQDVRETLLWLDATAQMGAAGRSRGRSARHGAMARRPPGRAGSPDARFRCARAARRCGSGERWKARQTGSLGNAV